MVATLDGVMNAPLRGPPPSAARAIEGAAGLVAPLARRLAEDGIQVLDVPATLGPRVRMLSIGHGRKSDEADVCPWASPPTPSEPGHSMPGRCRCGAVRVSQAPG